MEESSFTPTFIFVLTNLEHSVVFIGFSWALSRNTEELVNGGWIKLRGNKALPFLAYVERKRQKDP